MQHLFVFSDESSAIRFVQRLAHYFRDIAIYRDGASVHVIDPSRDRMVRILELAKTSESQFWMPVPRRGTLGEP